MFIVVSPQNPEPMYKQVTDQIKDAIADGTLNTEDKLPSIREMSKELNISIITIKRAYADLESEVFIYTRTGMGSFVANINKDTLRTGKLNEIKNEIKRILAAGEKVNIHANDVINIVNELGGKK